MCWTSLVLALILGFALTFVGATSAYYISEFASSTPIFAASIFGDGLIASLLFLSIVALYALMNAAPLCLIHRVESAIKAKRAYLEGTKHVVQLLHDPDGFTAFLAFCSSEFNSENPLFWRRVESLKRLPPLRIDTDTETQHTQAAADADDANGLLSPSNNNVAPLDANSSALLSSPVAVGWVSLPPEARLRKRHSHTPSRKQPLPPPIRCTEDGCVELLQKRVSEAKRIYSSFLSDGCKTEVNIEGSNRAMLAENLARLEAQLQELLSEFPAAASASANEPASPLASAGVVATTPRSLTTVQPTPHIRALLTGIDNNYQPPQLELCSPRGGAMKSPLEQLDHDIRHAFDHAQKEVVQMMQSNSWFRFRGSPVFQQLLDAHSSAGQGHAVRANASDV